MSLIDVENAKQIRDPMDVLIKMEVPEDVSVSYSGYASSSKVADAVLDERGWPMRILADLQGNGFQLNGACQLYDPTVIPSATNGKLGVRSNIGQRLSITVTGDDTINGLSIVASGTDAVHFNGQTAALSGGQVIIPVGASSITIEFDPLTADTRAEVSTAMPGTSIQVTNDSLISCVVSLRSDLSIDDPTLPESEINIDMYNDVDISAVVATIPDDTPITYSAGYVGDMSQERQFYLSDQITWEDNILSIHATDSVRFLDFETEPLWVPAKTTTTGVYVYATPTDFLAALINLFKQAGMDIQIMAPCFRSRPVVLYNVNYKPSMLIPRGNLRDLIAFINNVFKIEGLDSEVFSDSYGTLPDIDSFWLSYVDGGWPSFTTVKPSAKWSINEDDAGDVKIITDRAVASITVQHKIAQNRTRSTSVGNVDWVHDGPAYPNLPSDPMLTVNYSLPKDEALKPLFPVLKNSANVPILPATVGGLSTGQCASYTEYVQIIPGDITVTSVAGNGKICVDNKSRQDSSNAESIYTQVIPTNARFTDTQLLGGKLVWPWRSLSQAWNKLVSIGEFEKTAETETIEITGTVCETVDSSYNGCSNGNNGMTVEADSLINGYMLFPLRDAGIDQPTLEGYPKMAYESLLNRSNITGSFKWKGDPRMQPRDVVNFHRLDGTVEEITLENITIHHEGGGTYAEITYRKGVC